ncbi:hypothetical protein H6P81_019293 [Aristolochia fimbriata]|uniref:Uncharacterized protein n=1 Tax=Aristolochia fimbriata TaxID=158543 RepID=A0AAV7DVZ7_ARIFI|nr:hypothetical protein H6P81_019293 [Aristolochia fimbriata]
MKVVLWLVLEVGSSQCSGGPVINQHMLALDQSFKHQLAIVERGNYQRKLALSLEATIFFHRHWLAFVKKEREEPSLEEAERAGSDSPVILNPAFQSPTDLVPLSALTRMVALNRSIKPLSNFVLSWPVALSTHPCLSGKRGEDWVLLPSLLLGKRGEDWVGYPLL